MIPVQNTAEKRVKRRWHLILYLRVYERVSGALLGHVVDISETGVRLIRDEAIEPGETVAMRMSWRDEEEQVHDLNFDAECMWSGPDVNPDFHDVGFQFIQVDPAAVASIRQLVGELGFRGH